LVGHRVKHGDLFVRPCAFLTCSAEIQGTHNLATNRDRYGDRRSCTIALYFAQNYLSLLDCLLHCRLHATWSWNHTSFVAAVTPIRPRLDHLPPCRAADLPVGPAFGFQCLLALDK
jgi:hypothetical protein